MDKFNDYVSAEYLLENTPDNLRAIYGDARVKTASLKTGCKIEVTRRVLKRLVSPGNWSRLSIVRVTGPDDQSIAQFNRLIETCIPVHSNRREYPRRASLTLLSRPNVHNEPPQSRISPQSHFQMAPVRQSVDAQSTTSNYPNDFFQSSDYRAGSTTRELGMRAPNDNFRSSSVSYNNTPQSMTETVALSRKTASHSRSETTPKPRPRGIHKRTNDSALLNSPPKDMVAMPKKIPTLHRSKPEDSAISRLLSERNHNKDQSGSERTTLNDLTSATTDLAAGMGALRRSNLRNTSAPNNTKRLHLSKSKIYEFEQRLTQEQCLDPPRRPRRPRSLGARHRVQSITDVIPGLKREASHRSKSPQKKELKDIPQMLATLGNSGTKGKPKKPKRFRKSPLLDRVGAHSTGLHEAQDDSDITKGRSRRTPTASPKYSEKAKYETQKLNKVTIAVDNGVLDDVKPPHGNIHMLRCSAKDYKPGPMSQINCESENSLERPAPSNFDGAGEFTNPKSNSHKVLISKAYPSVSTPIEKPGSPIGMVSVENDFSLQRLGEHGKCATNSMADVSQLDHSSAGSVSMNETGVPTPLSSISIISNKTKEAPGSSVEKSGNDTIETNASKEKPVNHIQGSRSKSSGNEENMGAPSDDQPTDISENGVSASLTQSSGARRNKFKHGTEVLMTLSPIATLSYANSRTADFPLGILSSIQLPEYEDSRNLRIEADHIVRHLAEHEISVLSEEVMPSPFAAYEVNYSNAETDVVKLDNLTKFILPPNSTYLTSNITSINRKVLTQHQVSNNTSFKKEINNPNFLPVESYVSSDSVMIFTKPRLLLPNCQKSPEEGYLSDSGETSVGAPGKDQVFNESPYICSELSNLHEPLPPPPYNPEGQLPCHADTSTNQSHLPPAPECKTLQCENCELIKAEECCKYVEDGKRSSLMTSSINQDKMSCIFEGASLFSTQKRICESSSPLSSSMKLRSPATITPKQVVIQTSHRSGKNALTSPGHSSLPSSTSSIPFELPAFGGTESRDRMQQSQPKQNRRVKSADASPLHFDVSVDVSEPRCPRNYGNLSSESSQNCNASTIVSVDLEDMGTQENTHNATEFSNKGRMESPISITLITELQEDGCGTSTMESFCRDAAPAEVTSREVEATTSYDVLPDPTCNLSDSSNTTYVSSLMSESFY